MSTAPLQNKCLCVLLVVIALILQVSVAAGADDPRVVDLNGGFEVSEGGLPAVWNAFGPAEHMPVLSNEKPHGGSSFLRVPVGGFSAAQTSGVQQSIPSNLFKPGDIVTVAANVRLKKPLEEGMNVTVGFQIFGTDRKPLAYAHGKPENRPGEWQTVTSSVTIPAAYAQDDTIKVIANCFSKNAPTQENVVDFDDITLSITPAPKQPAP